MSKFKRGWVLAGQSWRVLRGHRGLLAYPLVGAVGALVLVGPFAAAGAYYVDERETVLGGVLLAVAVYLISFVTAFAAVALATAADAAMRGEPISLGAGFANASRHLPAISGWALINALLTVILSALESRGAIGDIVAGLIGGAWSVISLLAIPSIALEDNGPIGAIRRSTALFKQHWVGRVTGMAAIGLGAFLFGMLPAAALIAIGIMMLTDSGSDGLLAGGGLLIALGFLLLTLSVLVASALRQVFAVALFRYTTAGQAPAAFSADDLEQAIHHRGRGRSATA